MQRILIGALAAPVLLVAGRPLLAAAPKEPLIVTPMPDPDPTFVPPPAERRQRDDALRDASEDSRIEEAMQTFGRAIGEAALVAQQQIEAKCRQGQPEGATPEQRFAWAASCRYSRH